MLTDRKTSLPSDFVVPYLLLKPGDKSDLDQSECSTIYQCPLYGVGDRHLTNHQSALLDFIFMKSDVDSVTLVKRGAALLAVNGC